VLCGLTQRPLTTLLAIQGGALWTDTHATYNVVGYTSWCSVDWHTCHLQRCRLYIVVLCGLTHRPLTTLLAIQGGALCTDTQATYNVVGYTSWCSVDWHTCHLQRCWLYRVVLCGLTNRPLTTLLAIHRGALWTDTHATYNVVGYTSWCSVDWHTRHLQRCWLYRVELCGLTHRPLTTL